MTRHLLLVLSHSAIRVNWFLEHLPKNWEMIMGFYFDSLIKCFEELSDFLGRNTVILVKLHLKTTFYFPLPSPRFFCSYVFFLFPKTVVLLEKFVLIIINKYWDNVCRRLKRRREVLLWEALHCTWFSLTVVLNEASLHYIHIQGQCHSRYCAVYELKTNTLNSACPWHFKS